MGKNRAEHGTELAGEVQRLAGKQAEGLKEAYFR